MTACLKLGFRCKAHNPNPPSHVKMHVNYCDAAGDLSGGEKARVALAAFALVPCNLLLLDEASNHLDAATITALTTALQVSPIFEPGQVMVQISAASWKCCHTL